ncbi:mitochondrial carrier protein [Trypanosoma conorhini]|uniref:Mitochondrial carrier protein n=1 Tax=Trypanosoma conorhini TaxID=83891 RepID=A0A422Q7X8_9TRYP|nr:mitochondrial carrier protein [Trypanosoma conorhini]RNF26073.1 mitochondrial carrier protein [Trypanosoma conorhini]
MDGDVFLAFLPGAAHGLTTVALGHPLDTAKTRMQALGPRASSSFLVTMWNMARAEGVQSLYRGVTPPLVMSATKRSLQFAVWDALRKSDVQHAAPAGTSSSCGGSIFPHLVAWARASPFLSGAVAGGLGTFIGCPMHVIKIQTQFLTHHVTRNAWTCALDIYRDEGFSGYYRGFRYHMVKDVLFAGSYLGFYDGIKRWLRDFNAASAHTKWGPRVAAIVGGSGERSRSQLAFLAGSTSSMLTWALLYPLDTIKTIVQARKVGLLQVVTIFRQQRGAMYRGLGASLVRAGPVSGAAMVVYELAKSKAEQLLLHKQTRATTGAGGSVRL